MPHTNQTIAINTFRPVIKSEIDYIVLTANMLEYSNYYLRYEQVWYTKHQ